MNQTVDTKYIAEHLHSMRVLCTDLLHQSENYPCLERNTRRILSSIEMLELDFPDLEAPGPEKESSE